MNIDKLVVEHADWIRKKARRYYADPMDADDLAGETIYKCLSQGRKFNPGRSFKPWALAIMANTYITQYNRRKCVLFTGYCDYDPYSCEEYADQLASVNRIFSIVHDCSMKSCSIESVMLYAMGFSYEEISMKTGVPEGTVKSRVHLGRKMLRRTLEV